MAGSEIVRLALSYQWTLCRKVPYENDFGLMIYNKIDLTFIYYNNFSL